MSLEVIILAAGKGTRMRSKLPKVLHPLAGKAMLAHVIESAQSLSASKIHVVVGHGADQVKNTIDADVNWVLQAEQKGTGHAVAQAMPDVADDATVLVLYGDVPLTRRETLAALVEECGEQRYAMLTVNLEDPSGYGRIVRDDRGAVQCIVEQKDAQPEQLAIKEVNTGIVAGEAADFKRWLPKLSADNAQGEYYLTDLTAMAVAESYDIKVQQPADILETEGVNSRQQLAVLERAWQGQLAEQLMTEGASLADPARIDIRGQLRTGQDVSIDVNCVFEGEVELGDDVVIGPNCLLINSTVASGTVIKANSVLEDTRVGEDCDIGPFARLRPGTQLANGAKIGNFVETKKAVIGEGSKVNHLSYIGDAEIGRSVNVGAGTITCNYDGANKFKTTMADGVFIGSNSSLVAPENIGEDATVGAGSTITGDIGKGQLAVARGKQRNIDGWQRPVKNKQD